MHESPILGIGSARKVRLTVFVLKSLKRMAPEPVITVKKGPKCLLIFPGLSYITYRIKVIHFIGVTLEKTEIRPFWS